MDNYQIGDYVLYNDVYYKVVDIISEDRVVIRALRNENLSDEELGYTGNQEVDVHEIDDIMLTKFHLECTPLENYRRDGYGWLIDDEVYLEYLHELQHLLNQRELPDIILTYEC